MTARRFALAEGQPDTGAALAAWREQDWGPLLTLYKRKSGPDRVHLLEGLGELTQLGGAVPVGEDPNFHVIAAGVKARCAWRHRGPTVGAQVSKKGAMNMARLLEDAERDLRLAEGLMEKDGVRQAIGIRVAMGLGGDRGALRGYLSEHALPNVAVARAHLNFVAPKWYGSLEEMAECADEYARNPPTPAWIALLAFAAIEAWLYEVHFSSDRDARMRAHDYYVVSDAFLDRICSIDDRFWSANAGDAGLEMTHFERVFAHNCLAYLFSRRGSYERLARHLERIGTNLTAVPWTYLSGGDNLPNTLRDLRKRAGLRKVSFPSSAP